MDPIVVADDLCEQLKGPAEERYRRCQVLLASATGVDLVLGEVVRRGMLPRLLPTQPSPEGATLLAVLFPALGVLGLGAVVREILGRKGAYAAWCLERLITTAEQKGVLGQLFAELITAGLYERMVALYKEGTYVDSPGLRALAKNRPTYDADILNQGALRTLSPSGELLIVPGFTPPSIKEPLPLKDIPAAQKRLDVALADLAKGRGSRVLVTGGAVYPSGTPYNEALMMREYLLARGVPGDKILVDPHARHSTTNLRNAGRLMKTLGILQALVVTGFDRAMFSQRFYFAYQTLSTFDARCKAELGYRVGDLRGVDDAHVAFSPAGEVVRPNYSDPLDV